MAETVFNGFKFRLANADDDWIPDDFRALLLVGAVVIDPDDVTIADLLAAPNTEASDASYGVVALGSKTTTQNDAADRAEFDAATVDFTALDNETPTAMVIYKFVDGTDANDLLVSIHDTGFGSPANGAGYTVQFPNDVLRLS